MKISKIALVITILLFVISTIFGEEEQGKDNKSNRIAVVVNNYLSNEIKDNLNTYFEDLRNEGYEPILKEWSLENNPKPSELKEYLKGLYENGGLQGAVFIGDLPIAMFEEKENHSTHQGPFPTDHYYMDLESNEWEDSDSNGSMDKPILTKENTKKRAIWVSRIKLSQSTYEYIIGLLSGIYKNEDPSIQPYKDYFKKNHEFRTGLTLYPERSWNYITTEFADHIVFKSNVYYSMNKATDYFLGDISERDFLNILGQNYSELGLWDMHSSTDSIYLNRNLEKIFSDTIKTSTIKTAFLLPISCWIGDYTNQNYFVGSLLFSKNSDVLALIASTISLKSWDRDNFILSFQEGLNFGESYLKYLSFGRSYSFFEEFNYEDLIEEISRVVFGDGTLKRQRYLVGKDKVESIEKELISANLRQRITPGSVVPGYYQARFYRCENKIQWDKYYNEEGLSYRLEKKTKNGDINLVYEGKDNKAFDADIDLALEYYLSYIWDDTRSQFSIIYPSIKETNDLLVNYLLNSLEIDELNSMKQCINQRAMDEAISKESPDEVAILLMEGTNPDGKTSVSSNRPLIKAINNNLTQIMTLLLEAGANPNKLPGDFRSPLEDALGKAIATNSEDNLEIIRLLLEYGANPNEKESFASLPLDTAIRFKFNQIEQLLRAAGGKSEKYILNENQETKTEL